jgi:hypothetical protein
MVCNPVFKSMTEQTSSPPRERRFSESIQRASGRRKILLILGISLVVVLPCFWQERIQAGDLASHTYNAWLAQLIGQHQAPGLYLTRQWNNVLVDLLLAKLGPLVGFSLAEKIVAASCVLIFFWGVFRLMSVAARRPAWELMPAIAMIAYGWTFQMGFLNYYVSLGLASFAIAYFWRGDSAHRVAAMLLSLIALIAHPIGFLWLIATAIYVVMANCLSGSYRSLLLGAALIALLGLHFYISHHYRGADAVGMRFYRYLGPDQLVIYGRRYRLLGLAFLSLAAAIALEGFLRARSKIEWLRDIRTPVELWILSIAGIALLWEGITIPQYGTGLTFLPGRLSSISALLLCCVLATLNVRKWHFVALSACAVLFFAWMWQDTRVLNKMEDQAVSLLSGLPPGTRVIQTVWPLPGHRVDPDHIVDRACIGRCFTYANYEPSSLQFRIRVEPGSPIVVASAEDGLAMREGTYVVRSTDPPLVEIYQCDERDPTQLCLRKLVAGEVNGRLGYRPKY